jgi:hypothetical protein
MIEMGKRYWTRNGRDVRILCTDARGGFPVIGLLSETCNPESDYPESWTKDGLYTKSGERSIFDLMETSPYENWPMDAPVWVRNICAQHWR